MKREIKQHLIEKAVAGDSEAFAEIYFLLRDLIYGFAYRMTNQRLIAEDITQEVFMFFVEFPEKFDAERASLFTFLCGVARNKILNYLKKSGTRLETNDLEAEMFEIPINGNSPLKNLLDEEFSAELAKTVGNLSAFQREVLILREMEELSYAEIAEITKTSQSVVKSRLFQARKNLAVELAPYFKNEKEGFYGLHQQ